MKKIKVEQAVGAEILHDMTRIIPGKEKGRAFKRGHIITEEDIPILLSMGKRYVFIKENEMDSDLVFEEEAARILSELCLNDKMSCSDIKEGKIEIFSEEDGFFVVDIDRLNAINALDDIMIATRLGYLPIRKGDKLAGMRVIPLFVSKKQLEKAKKIAGEEPILKLLPFQHKKIALIITGSEIYHGLIKDAFEPVIRQKVQKYDCEIISVKKCDDDTQMIIEAILDAKDNNADIILCSGGMSVDPDDLTPGAIKQTGADIITYGTPVLPGAMFLVGKWSDGTDILGLPGSVMFEKTTIFDILFPYVLANYPLTKSHIAKLGYGGLALKEDVMTYPYCQFGKGV